MRNSNLSAEDFDALETVENELLAIDIEPSHGDLLAKIYDMPDSVIADLSTKYLPLKIAGAVDKQGRGVVHNALMDIRGLATAIDKTRLKTNEKAQAWIKVNNGEARRLTALLDPIKNHLQAERDNHDNQVAEIKAAEQKKLDDRNQKRMDALLAVGATIGLAAVVTMDEQAYIDYLALVTNDHKNRLTFEALQAAEAQAKALSDAQAKAKSDQEDTQRREAERLANAAARAENERIASELKAERDKFNAEQARINADNIAKNIAEKAKLESDAKAAQALEKTAAIEAAKPDAEKLQAFADLFMPMIPAEMSTAAGRLKRDSIIQAKQGLIDFIRVRAAELSK